MVPTFRRGTSSILNTVSLSSVRVVRKMRFAGMEVNDSLMVLEYCFVSE